MKICLISPLLYKLFHPDDKRVLSFGGAEIQFYQLGLELAKDKDFKVSFIVGDFYKEQPKVEEFRIQNLEFRIQIYKVFKYYQRIPLVDTLADFFKLWKAMKEINADIYLIRGAGSLAGKCAFLAKKVLKKKFIFCLAHDREANLNFFKKNNFYTNWLFRFALKNSDEIITQYQKQKEIFKKNFNLNNVVIKSAYPIENYQTKVKNYELRKYILWVGRLESWKRPEIFAKIATLFPDENFLLITNSSAKESKEKFSAIKNLIILEKIPFREMDSYFQRAKIFINTSITEGFPNTFIQAAKNGTPIISLNVNPDNFLEKYKCGFNAKNNFDEMLNNIELLLEKKDLWQRMSENSFKYTKENHDIKKIIEEYKKLFKKLKFLHMKQKIRICFLSPDAYTNFEPKQGKNIGVGGSETQLYLLATELAKDENFSVYFIVNGFGDLKSKIYQNVFVQKTISALPLIGKLFILFHACFFLLKNKADIYINRAKGLEVFLVVLIKKILGKKNIYMMAGDPEVDSIQKSLKITLFWWSVKNSDLIISQNKKQVDFLQNNFKKESLILKSFHYIPESKIQTKRESILWIGGAQYIKQPNLFLEIAKRFPDQRFVMICSINLALKNYFKEIKEMAKVYHNVEFIDYVPFNQIDSNFQRAKIFINTSTAEGFPNTFVQAAKNKTPIVSLNVNPDNILTKYKIGFCANGNFEWMIEHIKSLLDDSKLWREMSENGYKYAKENHNIKKIIEEYKKIFYEISNSR